MSHDALMVKNIPNALPGYRPTDLEDFKALKQQIIMRRLKEGQEMRAKLGSYALALSAFAESVEAVYRVLQSEVAKAGILFGSLEREDRDKVEAIRTFRAGLSLNARSLAQSVVDNYVF